MINPVSSISGNSLRSLSQKQRTLQAPTQSQKSFQSDSPGIGRQVSLNDLKALGAGRHLYSRKLQKSVFHSTLLKAKPVKDVVASFNILVREGLSKYSSYLLIHSAAANKEGLEFIHKLFPKLEQRFRDSAGDKKQNVLQIWESVFQEALDLKKEDGSKVFNKTSDIARLFLHYSDRYLILYRSIEAAAFESIREKTGIEIIKSFQEKDGFLEALKTLVSQPEGVDVGYRMTPTTHPTFLETVAIAEIQRNLSSAFRGGDEYEIEQLIKQLSQTQCEYSTRRKPLEESVAFLNLFGPMIYESLTQNQAQIYELMRGGELPFENIRSLLSSGDWGMFDRDGNPFVKAEETKLFTLLKSRTILGIYIKNLQGLRDSFSVKDPSLQRQLCKILDRLDKSREQIDVRIKAFAPNKDLEESLDRFGQKAKRAKPYSNADELKEDLLQLRQLSIDAGDLRLSEIERVFAGADIFGLHFSSGEIRQNAGAHAKAIDEICQKLHLTTDRKGYKELPLEEKLKLLNSLIDNKDHALSLWPNPGFSEATQEILNTMKAISWIHEVLGKKACDSYIISNSFHGQINLKEVLALWRIATGKEIEEMGVFIIPLVETPEDLQKNNLKLSLNSLTDTRDPHIDRYFEVQKILKVLFGPSDSSIRMGTLPALWNIYKAANIANDIATQQNRPLQIYFGSGGAVARGALNVEETLKLIKAQIEDCFMLWKTVQGGEISARFGSVERGSYYAAKALDALLGALVSEPELHILSPENFSLIDGLMEASAKKYQELFKDPKYCDFYRTATPSAFPHTYGSRPDKHTDRNTGMEGERAIPTVENFARTAQFVQIWYGMGTGLQDLKNKGTFEDLKNLYKSGSSSQLQTYIETLRYGLAHTEMFITEHHKEGIEEGDCLWTKLNTEFELCKQLFEELIEESIQLKGVMAESIKIGNQARIAAAALIQYAMNEISKIDLSDQERKTLREILNFGINEETAQKLEQKAFFKAHRDVIEWAKIIVAAYPSLYMSLLMS